MSESDKYTYVLNVDPQKMCLGAFASRAEKAVRAAGYNVNSEPLTDLMILCADLLEIVFKCETEGVYEKEDVLMADAVQQMRSTSKHIESLYPEVKEFLDVIQKKHEDNEA